MIDTGFYKGIYDRDLEWIGHHSAICQLESQQVLTLTLEQMQFGILLEGELQYCDGQETLLLTGGDVLGDLLLSEDENVREINYLALKPSQAILVESAALNSRLNDDRIFAARLKTAISGLAASRLLQAKADKDEINIQDLEALSVASSRFIKLLERLS